MHKNPVWLGFLAIFSCVLIWYTADAAWKFWVNTSLTKTVPAETAVFSVKEDSSDKFYMNGQYTFSINGQHYEGATTLSHPMFRNQLAAQEKVAEFEAKGWTVWFNPQNPTYSSLQKKFPFKECLYAGVLWVLFIYFFFIGWKVTRGKSHTQK